MEREGGSKVHTGRKWGVIYPISHLRIATPPLESKASWHSHVFKAFRKAVRVVKISSQGSMMLQRAGPTVEKAPLLDPTKIPCKKVNPYF